MINVQTNNGRIGLIDFLKGIAIIAVVLYHFGILKNGYLGVDVFLVINGYLIASGTLKQLKREKHFSAFDFLIKRLIRLWPELLLACFIAFVLGYFLMLPDDYENLSETVVASCLFANNILQAITTHNYWDAVQEYKPLMHTWYLGVLMQFYLIYGIWTAIVFHFLRKDRKIFIFGISILTVFSFLIYIFPGDSANKFYYLPYRFWEIGIGVLLATAKSEGAKRVCFSKENVQVLGHNNIRNKYLLYAIRGGIA